MEKLIVLYNDELFNYLRNNLVSKSKNNIKSLLKNECVYMQHLWNAGHQRDIYGNYKFASELVPHDPNVFLSLAN